MPISGSFLFGLALSPRTFMKCVDAALVPLRHQGIRIMNYIDDWLILAQLHQLKVRHQDVVLDHMKEMGLRLNAKRSVLSPLQRTTFLGMVWARPVTHCQTVSETVRSYGSSIQHDTFWTAVVESTTAPWSGGSGPKGFPRSATPFT